MKMKNWILGLLLVSMSTSALADDIVGALGGSGMLSNILMLGGFLFIFYFMLIRPQSKRAKEHQNLIANIAKDDEVITSGGIVGKVLKVSEQFITIAIADGIEVKIQKQAISASIPKGTMKNI